jgi:hypothetical protein
MAAIEMLNSDAIVLVLVFIEFLYSESAASLPPLQRGLGQCNFDTGTGAPSAAVANIVNRIITQYLR